MKLQSTMLALLGLAGHACADPTWPSPNDELEEIMYQLTSFRARKFADSITPCTNEASGPGRINAAEWLRVAFHDMSTASNYFMTGGLDGSLQYELTSSENTGPGHKTTIEFMAPFVSPRSSLADLIAMGVYMSVRSCGGPVVPIRGGRIDATQKGDPGVPQPQNSILIIEQQFSRMGFSRDEMIQVTACGHTLGGVHSQEFPDLVPPNSVPNGMGALDSSAAVFDNKVVTEYLAGNTTNPLVVGPSVKILKNSDFKVFNADRNVTMQALADAARFRDTCKTVLQKMIDVVFPPTQLTDPIQPYDIKPVNLQLTLVNGGTDLHFTGFIRVKTTNRPKENIKGVTITYKNHDGASACGNSCTISATIQGISKGFDDSFAFFPIDATIPADTGISSFVVAVNHVDGSKEDFNNNGNGYPIQDSILFQKPQSCVLPSSGALTVVAAVRNNDLANGAKATIHYKVAQDTSPVAALKKLDVDLTKGKCVGKYTLFNVQHTVEGGKASEGYVDVTAGGKSDSFKKLADVGGTCSEFLNPAKCDTSEPPDSTTTTTTTSISSTVTSSTTDSSTSSTPSESSSSTDSSSSSESSSSSSSSESSTPTDTSTTSESVSTPETSTSSESVSSTETTTSETTTTTSDITSTTTQTPAPTPYHRDTVGGYNLVSCWSEGSGVRALNGAAYADDEMTLEKCMGLCKDYVYWGTEYGRECYCGNKLASSSKETDLKDCNMVCGGDASQFCGAGSRLELYSTTASQPTPTGTLAHKPTVSPYTLVGCWTEGQGARALDRAATSGADMTNEKCAKFCSKYRYFGTEYGSECYCGSYLADSSKKAPLEDCSMTCAGDEFEYCGAASRLELYMNDDIVGGAPEQPAAVGNYALVGCQTEGNGTRALPDSATAADNMDNTACATFCKGYEYFGTEYGRECYCGNKLAASSLEAPASECHMLCAGNDKEYCGSANRLSVYKVKDVNPVTGCARGQRRRRMSKRL